MLGVLSQTRSLLLRLFQPARLSPYGISFASVLADQRKVLSSLPCLTLRSKESNSAWPLRSRNITLLLRYYGPLRHPPAFSPFPVSTVIGPNFLQGFLLRARRTSPVSIVSLLPCRCHYPAGMDYPLSQSQIAHAVFTSLGQVRPPDSIQS